MSWTTAVADLRTILNDGPTDLLRHRKRVFGDINGTNKTFKTLEFRRVTNFTTAVAPLGVYKTLSSGGAPAIQTVDTDDLATGEFVLHTAPADGDVIEATYYAQWFIDTEITMFLTYASQWLGFGSTFSNLDPGLQPAALSYSASRAYQKIVVKLSTPLGSTYLLEDMPPEKKKDMIESYIKLSEMFEKDANQLKENFYTRQGQSLAPLFGVSQGRVRDLPPRA